MARIIGFNEDELRILALLADDKGHGLWEMSDKLEIDKGYLSKILRRMKIDGLIDKKERPLYRPPKEPGPHTEYPWYIQKDELPLIARKIHSQIVLNLCKSNFAFEEYESAQGSLKPFSAEELIWDQLDYFGKAEEVMELLDIPLFRDEVAKIYRRKGTSSRELRDLLLLEIGLTSS